jgi:hypothetical protein
MSHTYHDEPTGVRFHYNSDLSGDVSVSIPAGKGTKTHHTVEIPAEALSRFIYYVMLDLEEVSGWLDRFRDWLNKHTNAVSGPVEPPPGIEVNGERVSVDVPQHKFKFEIGDQVFLTFKEAEGDTGEVIDTGFQARSWDGGRYEYANVRLDRDGTETGPMPVTCICHRRDMPY